MNTAAKIFGAAALSTLMHASAAEAQIDDQAWKYLDSYQKNYWTQCCNEYFTGKKAIIDGQDAMCGMTKEVAKLTCPKSYFDKYDKSEETIPEEPETVPAEPQNSPEGQDDPDAGESRSYKSRRGPNDPEGEDKRDDKDSSKYSKGCTYESAADTTRQRVIESLKRRLNDNELRRNVLKEEEKYLKEKWKKSIGIGVVSMLIDIMPTSRVPGLRDLLEKILKVKPTEEMLEKANEFFKIMNEVKREIKKNEEEAKELEANLAEATSEQNQTEATLNDCRSNQPTNDR